MAKYAFETTSVWYRFRGHLKTVLIHKYRVAEGCFRIGLYKQGYTSQIESSGGRASIIVMEAIEPNTDLQRVQLYVERVKLFPIEIRMWRKNSTEDILIKIKACDMDKNYPDSMFVFNKKDYPTAEVIDLR